MSDDLASAEDVPKGHDRRKQHGLEKGVVVREIKVLIARHGIEAGTIMARTKYPHVEKSTWSRWLKDANARPMNAAAAIIRRAAEIIPENILPAAPSPAVISRSPGRASASLNFMEKLTQLYADGEMLREFSLARNPDGTEKIKIANHFAGSIKIRSDLLERWMQVSQMLYDWDQMAGFYAVVVEEIAKTDPETSARIMERLDALNREKGFNASTII